MPLVERKAVQKEGEPAGRNNLKQKFDEVP